ncbi:OLC1v1027002C1 [Oldenlandia corymbosa var. corymbosa]|uniref:OLC1v1027002C1 n=1 Tax=Oldenlandia corymbosa var. corymbosa TaxID=529605 RepID=A0AAV1C8H0_OLDCO|nr:OLC1v1027002C1 [Oldenlandia corymbosa var. corymbosa]
MNFNLFKFRSFSALLAVTQSPSLLNSRIQVLVKQERHWEALQVYGQESCFPLHISKFTLPSILKACTSLSSPQYGRAIHGTIITLGLQFDPFIATSLVNMYFKRGDVYNAFQVFDNVSQCKTLVQDVPLWNSVIDGFLKNGFISEGILQFRRMQFSGVSPDGYTLCIMLGLLDHDCGNVQRGREIHGYIVRRSLHDTFVATALIDLYSRYGRPMDAWYIFHGLENKNRTTVVWNVMINGFNESGWWRKSLEVYSFAKNEGCVLVSSTLSSALAACSHGGCSVLGRQVQSDVIKLGFQEEPYVCTSLLTMYAKCGLLVDAEKVFHAVARKEVEICNSMISAYVDNSFFSDALDTYQQMRLSAIPSDSFTVPDIIVCCNMMELYDLGRTLHAEIVKRPIQNNVAIQSSLLTMYSKCGNLKNALDIFSSIGIRDVIAWGSIISGHCLDGQFMEALDLFKLMESDAVKPDSDIVAALINSSTKTGNTILGLCIHGTVIKRGLEVDAYVGTGLMDLYSKLRQPNSVASVFSDIKHKNLVVWNSLISCYCQNNLIDLSISLIPQILQSGLTPDSVSVTTVLLAISSAAALLKGKAIHACKIRIQIPDDIQMENALIDMYMKCGSLSHAKHVFQKMSCRNLVTWNSVISGYGSHGECLKAIHTFNEMRSSGISPDDITFLSLISSCNHSGLVDIGLDTFELMREYRVEPRMEHYVNMVDLLGRAGLLNDAYAFIKKMHIEADRSVWLCLLSACRVHRNVELGELAANNLLKIDPDRSSNYIQLLNLYVEAGLHVKAADLRILMRQKGLKKVPGFSWIEVKNRIDVFFSGDSSSIETIQIFEALKSLNRNMRKTQDSHESVEEGWD